MAPPEPCPASPAAGAASHPDTIRQPVFVALDLETTGLDPQTHEIIEVGAVRFEDAGVLAMTVQDCGLQLLVKPQKPIDRFIGGLTGITNQMVQDQAAWPDVVQQVQAFLAPPASHFIAHNIGFEQAFLTQNAVSLTHLTLLDTYDMVHMFIPTATHASLGIVCRGLSLHLDQAHRAAHDALVTGQLFMRLRQRVQKMPDAAIGQILAHASPDWPYRFLFTSVAKARHLPQTTTNTPVSRSHLRSRAAAAAPPGHPTVNPDESTSLPAAGVIQQALQPGVGTVLPLPGDGLHSQELAQACVRWAAADNRHLLLCLPSFQEFSYQQRMLQALHAFARELAPGLRIAYRQHPGHLCDLTRLNAWKAGRTLDFHETRFLTKVLYWCALSPPDYRRLHSLFLFSHESGAHDGRVRWPLVSGTEASDPADLEPGGDAFLPVASSGAAGMVTVMDHDTLLLALDADPNFARHFDALILDDLWNLSHAIPETCTQSVTLDTVDYLHDRVRRLGPSGTRDDIVAWLHQQPQGAEAIADLMSQLDTLDPAWRRLQSALQAVAADRQEANQQHHEVAMDIRDLRRAPGWPTVREAWQDYEPKAQALDQGLDVLMEALPDIDADVLPDTARYIQQIRSLHHELCTAIAHMGPFLDGGTETDDAVRTWVRWLVMRPEQAHCEFRRTSLWTEAYVDLHIRAAFETVLFLHRGRAQTSPQDFPAVQLGLAPLVHAQPPATPDTPELQIVMPELSQSPGTREVADLVAHIAAQTTGCTLLFFTGRTPLLETADCLEVALAGTDVPVMVHGRDACQPIASGLQQSGPKVLCGTYGLLQDIALDTVDVQCTVITRIPFPPRSHPIRDQQSHRSQMAAAASNEFQAFVLPHVRHILSRVIDQLTPPASPRGSLVLLDSRFRQPYMQGNRQTGQKGMLASWPRAIRTYPPLARTASMVGDWLQGA